MNLHWKSSSHSHQYIPFMNIIFFWINKVEEFWSIYAYLKRPDTLPVISDLHLFREGIRPIFEDPANKDGGKWTLSLRKGIAVRYWEQLVMAIVGDQFWSIGDELCGIVLSIRNSKDLISVWNKSSDNGRVNLKIRYDLSCL